MAKFALKEIFWITTAIGVMLLLFHSIPDLLTYFVSTKLYAQRFTSTSNTPCFVHKPCSGGRLGNQMSEYASAYGIAVANNCTLIIEDNHPLIKYFPNLRARVLPAYSNIFKEDSWRTYSEVGSNKFSSSLMNLPHFVHIQIRGYLCSWKYFRFVFNDITQMQFSFDRHIKENANRVIYSAKANGSIVVGVHVRRGDYLSARLVAFGYVVPPLSYFITAMEFFRKDIANIVFIVSSNDIAWCKKNLNFSDVVFSSLGRPIDDMAVLALSDHQIISVGSYSWWSALLSVGSTIVYEKQFKAVSKHAKNFGALNDFFYPGWIIANETNVVGKVAGVI